MLGILVESAVRSLALAAAVWFGLWLVRAQHARLQSMAWTLVLGAALVMPLTMQWHILEITAPQRLGQAAPKLRMPLPSSPTVERLMTSGKPNDRRRVIDWAALAQNGYLAVTILLLGRVLTGLLLTARIWRRARPVHEEWAAGSNIRETDELAAPAAIGGCILIPSEWREWEETKLKAVAAHERAHVKWADFYVQLASRIHSAIFWFSPLPWWLHKQLVAFAEAGSDDTALENADSGAYAEILLYFGQRPQRVSGAVAMARPATVSRRIERILFRTEVPGKPGWVRYSLAATCIAALAFLAAGSSLQARSSASEAGFWRQSADAASGNGSTVWTSQESKGEPYVIVSGNSLTMSGSPQEAEQARTLRGKIRGEYVWFLHDGKAYVITDAATLERARVLFKPQEELGRQQAALGAQQAALGEQQARLGQQQAGVTIRMPDLSGDIADVQARIQELEKEMPATDLREREQRVRSLEDELKNVKEKDVTQSQLGEYQSLMAELQSHLGGREEARAEVESRISELQGRLGELQSQAGEAQARLGAQQAALGEQQAKLGAQQAKLGREQQRQGEIASRQMHQILSEALKNGVAKPAP
jgi:hypothetical protein